MDWLLDLVETADLGLVREAIGRVAASEGYLDPPEATDALAAIEVVLCALGRPKPEGIRREKLVNWVSRIRPAVDEELISESVRAIERILGSDSELLELWEDTEDLDAWRAKVEGLRVALSG
ncbi:MAG: DUF4259 domain-containing protein [Rhodanobacteraceae bacterium]|nr:DUF4259 domain-containing protein [Rhodanobacteraceae bacterium]